MDDVIIVGGGICGLALALALHRRNIACRVYERAPEITELGVGITLLPHAMRELTALGLGDELLHAGIENRQSEFFNRFGQSIYREPRGKFAGYAWPEVGIHRGRLQKILHRAAVERLGADRIITNHACVHVEQDDRRATAPFRETTSGRSLPPACGSVIVACDGVNSTIRKQFYPDDALAFAGINTWRGVTVRKPILDGTHVYPDRLDPDREDRHLPDHRRCRWPWPSTRQLGGGDQAGSIRSKRLEQARQSRRFPANLRRLEIRRGSMSRTLIRGADSILEYPMVDKDPVAHGHSIA